MNERITRPPSIECPPVPVDLLSTAVLERSPSGVYYFDRMTLPGHVRMDELLRAMGQAVGITYLTNNPSSYSGNGHRHEAQVAYDKKRDAMSVSFQPSISYVDGGKKYTFEDLHVDTYNFSVVDILKQGKLDELPFLLQEGLIDWTDYVNFAYYDARYTKLVESGLFPATQRMSSEQRKYSDRSIIRQARNTEFSARNSGFESLNLQKEDTEMVATFCRQIKEAGSMSPDVFEEGVRQVLGNLDLVRNPVYIFLKDYYQSVIVEGVYEQSRKGGIDDQMRRSVESVKLWGYLDDYKEYVDHLSELSLLKNTIEAEKLDSLRTLLTGVLQATADYGYRTSHQPFMRSIPLKKVLEYNIRQAVKSVTHKEITSGLDSVVPRDIEGVKVLLAKMIRDTSSDNRRSSADGYTIIEDYWRASG